MEAKFTKGEWRQSHREKADGMYRTEVYDEDGMTICTVAWHQVPIKGGYTIDREANAKLIAAAPLMYEALRSIYDDREAFSDLFDSQQAKVKEALKKATE